MSRVCEVCGKKPSVGNLVSHANNKTAAVWYPKSAKITTVLMKKPDTIKRVKVCTRCIRSGFVKKAI